MKSILFVMLLILTPDFIAYQVTLEGKLEPGSIVLGNSSNAVSVKLNNMNVPVDDNGNFVLGFDRDDTGDFFLRIKYRNGNVYLKKFTLSDREYDVQEINNMKEHFVEPPDSVLQRIETERMEIEMVESRIGEDDRAYYKTGFIRPVSGGVFSGIFGSQRILNGVSKSPHNGIDIALPRGTEVRATADGIVAMRGNNYYYRGNFVVIDHGQGLYSKYFHLSKISVAPGEQVKKGDKIGEVGSTGRSTGPHLHWSVQWFDKRIDPLCLLK